MTSADTNQQVQKFTSAATKVSGALRMAVASKLNMADVAPAGVNTIEITFALLESFKAPGVFQGVSFSILLVRRFLCVSALRLQPTSARHHLIIDMDLLATLARSFRLSGSALPN